MPEQLPRVLSTARAQELGFPRGEVRALVRRGLWRALRPGVVLTRPEQPVRFDWLSAALVAAGDGAAISGLDAVRLAGLTSARDAHAFPLVLSPRGDVRRSPGVRVRTTHRPYTVRLAGSPVDPLVMLPVTSVARAVADAATVHAPGWAVRAWATEAVQRRICTIDQLAAEYDAAPRRNSAALRTAINDVRDGARSIAEVRSAQLLSAVALPPFELNVPVLIRGVLVAVVDVLFRELRAVVEIDGQAYHDGEGYRRTLDRHNELTALGLAVRHCAPSTLVPGWADGIAGWLRRRAGELDVPFRTRRRALVPMGAAGPTPLSLP